MKRSTASEPLSTGTASACAYGKLAVRSRKTELGKEDAAGEYVSSASKKPGADFLSV